MTRDHSLDEFIDAGVAGDASDSDNDANTEIGSDSNSKPNDAGDETAPTDDTRTEDYTTTDSTATAVATSADTTTESETRDDVSPAVATLQCDPNGVSCPHCGDIVTQRWRAQQQVKNDTTYICGDCKDW